MRIGVIVDSENADGASGLTLGAEEGKRSAALFQREVEILMEDASRSGLDDSARRVLERHPDCLIAGVAAAEGCWRLSELAGAAAVPLLNARSTADDLRHAHCATHLFHVVASSQMLANARAMRPGSTALMWHSGLERFGAAQLNTRFQSRFRQEMSGSDWAGWTAVKIAVEAGLRTGTSGPRALQSYLTRGDTRFDGHKGVPLWFRPSDHQLLQPLYCLDPGGEVTQVPAFSGSDTGRERFLLDSLGGTPAGTRCG